MLPDDCKDLDFKNKVKKGKPESSPYSLCKVFIKDFVW